MPKKIAIEIKESFEILKKDILKSEESKDELKRDRIQTLICIKEGFYFQSDIAYKIGRTEKTIRSWIQKYSKNGYGGLLKEKRGGNNTRKLSNKVVKYISKLANGEISQLIEIDSDYDVISYDYEISSFTNLKSKCEEKLSEIISYDAFYSHLRRNHKKEFEFLKNYFSKKKRNKKDFSRSTNQNERKFAEYGF